LRESDAVKASVNTRREVAIVVWPIQSRDSTIASSTAAKEFGVRDADFGAGAGVSALKVDAALLLSEDTALLLVSDALFFSFDERRLMKPMMLYSLWGCGGGK